MRPCVPCYCTHNKFGVTKDMIKKKKFYVYCTMSHSKQSIFETTVLLSIVFSEVSVALV